MSASMAAALDEIRDNRRRARDCNPQVPGKMCQCHICKWGVQVERIKGLLSKEDAALVEDMACAIADAETEVDMMRFLAATEETLPVA